MVTPRMHPHVQLNGPTLRKYAEIHTSRDTLRKRRRRPVAGQLKSLSKDAWAYLSVTDFRVAYA